MKRRGRIFWLPASLTIARAVLGYPNRPEAHLRAVWIFSAHGSPMLATILSLLLLGLVPCAIIIAVYERAAHRNLKRKL